jgi:outer membrane protein assembly factor BamB
MSRLIGLAFAILFPVLLQAADWPHWRGPSRNDHSPESSGFRESGWLPEKPEWQARVGEGASSPIVVGDAVYVLGYADGRDHLRCLNLKDGKIRWQVDHKSPRYGRFHTGDEGLYSGPSSTPEYDPASKFLFTLSSDGDLRCFDTLAKGQLIWSKNLYDEFQVGKRPRLTKAPLRDYGYTSSPLVLGDIVVAEVGSTERGTVMAFETKTGKLRWSSQLKDEAGHTGGMALMTVEKIPCLVVLTQRNLAVLRLDAGQEGKTLATFPWVTDFANSIAAPAVHGDAVLITAAYNQNALVKVRITLQGASEVWRAKTPSKVCTPVIAEGRVFLAWQKLRCLEWETGKVLWEGGQFGDPGSCILTRDKKLLTYGGKGRLVLSDATAEKYQELARKDLGFRSEAWPHLVLSQGRLLCRDRQGELICFRTTNP